jgi:CRISPR-associated protein Cmr6
MVKTVLKGVSKGGMMASIPQTNPETPLFPLPAYLEKYRDKVQNFGFYFNKFYKYQWNGDKLETQQSWNNGQKGRDRKDYEWALVNNQVTKSSVMKDCAGQLSDIHDKQTRYLKASHEVGAGIIEISAKSSTRFLTGIGQTSPTEVGMVFDRNTGLPFLPASSIKGAVRYAYCVNFALNNPEKIKSDQTLDEKEVEGLETLFGATDTNKGSRGGFAFMDTYSEAVPDLVVDIMNPHHGAYYRGESPEGPVEIESPIPIKFLAVEKGFIFKFRGFFLTAESEKYRIQLLDAFHTAMTDLGLGAKTAVGYGRFQDIQDMTPAIIKEVEHEKVLALEMKKKEEARVQEARRLALEKAEKERIKAEKEAIIKARDAKEEELAAEYQKKVENAEGIDLAILQLEKGDEQMAINMFDLYLTSLKTLNEKERKLALLVKEQFKSIKKKAKKAKLVRKAKVEKLLKG